MVNNPFITGEAYVTTAFESEDPSKGGLVHSVVNPSDHVESRVNVSAEKSSAGTSVRIDNFDRLHPNVRITMSGQLCLPQSDFKSFQGRKQRGPKFIRRRTNRCLDNFGAGMKEN